MISTGTACFGLALTDPSERKIYRDELDRRPQLAIYPASLAQLNRDAIIPIVLLP